MKLILASLLVLALLIFPACTQPAEAPSEGATPPAPTVSEDEEAARQVVFAYWEAFNNYDVEGVLSYLEESYRLEREEGITSEIDQMQAVGVKLGVEEEAEPTTTPEGKVEIKMLIDVPMPMPDRHVTYQLEKINDEWKICGTIEE